MGWVSRALQAMWRNAPRRLSFTRAGRVVVGLALATGFAAINTGNNLLFLGWGLVLSGIVISGLLSEAALRYISVDARPPLDARAEEPSALSMSLRSNATRFASFGLDVIAVLSGPGGDTSVAAPFVLRLAPSDNLPLASRWVPARRGRYQVSSVAVSTAYPFGFFVKTRPFELEPVPTFYVAPARVDVDELMQAITARSGASPASVVGAGEDHFGMRDFRVGDDLRRVKWRRVARTRRWVVVEHEAEHGRQVLVWLALGDAHDGDVSLEHLLSVAASLCEQLVAQGFAVGLVGPGTYLPPAIGARRTREVLFELARLRADDAPPAPTPPPQTFVVALCAPGASAPPHADVTLTPRLGAVAPATT